MMDRILQLERAEVCYSLRSCTCQRLYGSISLSSEGENIASISVGLFVSLVHASELDIVS
jgi:hypothetical protein